MSKPTVAAFSETLRELHLLEPSQLDEVKASLLALFPDAHALTRELVRRGWLTPFQANQLFIKGGAGLVLGSYVLMERLGEGGMGEVYRARNWKVGRIVALKIVRPDRKQSESVLRRFRREIEIAS